MGRRSRQRAAAAPPAAPATPNRSARRAAAAARPGAAAAAAAKKAPRPPRERALDRLPPARKVLAKYVLMAMVVAILVMVGIAVVGGTLGPFVVLAYAMLGAGGAYRYASTRLRDLPMTNEDRLLQTLAGGLLGISLLFAIAGAILL